MTDGKREKAAFEPPPWERDAFDELARRRAAEEARAEAATAAIAAEAAAGAGEIPEPAVTTTESVPEDPAATPGPPAPKAELDDRLVEAMLVQLQGEVPSVQAVARPVAGAASALMVLFGLIVLGMSIVFVRDAAGNGLATAGAVMVGLLGLSFIAGAIVVWVRATRGKGN
ncbi:MAG: hypothetical protein Q7W30_03520 [Coriobacteriia bacterium]|nr:hypothetical protein [Coriobacteriia bacterium]